MNDFSINSTVADRYTILSVVGTGGMGKVYRAHDALLGKDVALKVLNPKQATVERKRERFRKEFEILRRVAHPGVVPVFDYVEAAPTVFYSMQLISGAPLSDSLTAETNLETSVRKNKRMLFDDALPVLMDLAKVLVHVHESGFVYCDLKPQNVLLLNENSRLGSMVNLIDFGIAQEISAQIDDESAAAVGTTYYMSPEQIRSELLDIRSDIYSFGAVAFELLAGTVPFSSEANYRVTASHLVEDAPSIREFFKTVPKEMDRLIQICMSKNRADRYDSMDEVLGRLRAMKNKKAGALELLRGLFKKK